jgi:hypothetical protein
MRKNISISLNTALIANIDGLRGDIPRSRFIESSLKKDATLASNTVHTPLSAVVQNEEQAQSQVAVHEKDHESQSVPQGMVVE